MPEITSADEKLRVISQDWILRVQEEQRDRAERDALARERDPIIIGHRQGLKEGLDEGHRQGLKEGLDEGRREGLKEAVLKVLAARGLPVSAALRERVLACGDLARLDQCLTRALTVASADELLAELQA